MLKKLKVDKTVEKLLSEKKYSWENYFTEKIASNFWRKKTFETNRLWKNWMLKI